MPTNWFISFAGGALTLKAQTTYYLPVHNNVFTIKILISTMQPPVNEYNKEFVIDKYKSHLPPALHV
jgi:hypothetical protein